jgi:hypothetical protein
VAEDAEKPLTEVYHDWLVATVDENGFEIPHGLIRLADGTMTVVALAVPPAEAYKVMISQFDPTQAVEMIFALDRFTKPGQGINLGDVMAGFHVTRGAGPRPFIVEYQFAPRIVKPIEWTNVWWNAALIGELTATLRQLTGIAKL